MKNRNADDWLYYTQNAAAAAAVAPALAWLWSNYDKFLWKKLLKLSEISVFIFLFFVSYLNNSKETFLTKKRMEYEDRENTLLLI